jgi:hypothetical protein
MLVGVKDLHLHHKTQQLLTVGNLLVVAELVEEEILEYQSQTVVPVVPVSSSSHILHKYSKTIS